jgi:high-affinity iron transporter
MLGALVIVFREVIEAGLIVGIVLAATRGVTRRGWWVSAGIAAGVVGSCVVAIFAGAISNAFQGSGQELLNAAILLIAVGMLIWHNVWMAKHGRELAAQMQAVGRGVAAGERPLIALAIVVGLAVLREGSEVVLFLYGMAVSTEARAIEILGGGALGLLLASAVSALGYFGLLVIPTRHLFRVTGVLIALLAAGMAAQAMAFLTAAGVIERLDTVLWDTSAWLPESSIVGRLLQTLLGYVDRPTELQLVAYGATLAIMAGLMHFVGARQNAQALPTRAA